MKVMIVADDLTGALDSAAPFAMAGLRTVVLRRIEGIGSVGPGTEVLALSTGSRDGSREAAQAAVARALDLLPRPPEILMKKVDSRLKGHIAAETGLLADWAGRGRCLALPAIPDMGRVVRAGAVTGSGVATPIPVAAALSPLAADAPDCASDGDLDAALEAAGSLRDLVLVGARGLSAALARRIGRGLTPLAGSLPAPLLMAVGSRDPITLAQIAALEGIPAEHAPDGRGLKTPDTGYTAPVTLVRMTDGGGGVPAAEAGARFAQGIAARIRRSPPATLLACGGETANAVLAALGIDRLDLDGDILLGIPLARAQLDGVPLAILTKSGGFGGAESLRALADMVKSADGFALPLGLAT
ncbi:four-carbon acid sugar kinase family protein [Frigidibacter sp. MR17.14]|uniref:four-carbon acid sugar kinase family protein n=1 Tax=Frigidibacter sp. MR17.14 TaxID=3126509 RepID=UPI003012DC5F